jgi:hypothetical protein
MENVLLPETAIYTQMAKNCNCIDTSAVGVEVGVPIVFNSKQHT